MGNQREIQFDGVKEPLPASEPAERYDIIIAANAFHDARSIESAMIDARQRLKPSG